MLAGELLSLRADLAQGFIMRWGQLTKEQLSLFKDEYQALNGRPIKAVSLQDVECAASMGDVALAKAPAWKFSFELRLKKGAQLVKEGRIGRASTMPETKELVFCAKSIKLRNQWVRTINNLLL